MPVIPNGTAQVNLIFSGAQLPTGAQCTFGVDVDLFAGAPSDVASAVISDFAPVMVNLNASTTLSSVLVKFGPNATGASAEVTSAVVGSDGGAAASPNCTYLIRKHTADGGRAGRGRMYLPGVSEADIGGNGSIDSTFHTAMQADLDTFLAAMAANDLPLLLLHEAGSPISTPSLITALQCDGTSATQRRRLRR